MLSKLAQQKNGEKYDSIQMINECVFLEICLKIELGISVRAARGESDDNK